MTDTQTVTIDELRRMVPAEVRGELDARDFEEKLLKIDAAIERGEHIWEMVGDAANSEREADDVRRWNIVDLAARVVKRYGDDQIGEFAKRANVAKRSAQDAAQMGRIYTDRSRRAKFLKDNPTQTYSHLRTATRGGDTETAYRILGRSSKRGMTVDELSWFITRWKVINKLPTRPRRKKETEPIADFTTEWFRASAELSEAFRGKSMSGKVRVVVYPE